MTAVFLRILNNAVLSCFVVGAVVLLRLVLRKSPGWLTAAMWGLVAIRLIMPFSLASPTSLIPVAEPIAAIESVIPARESDLPEAAEPGDEKTPENAIEIGEHDAFAGVLRADDVLSSRFAVLPMPAEQTGQSPATAYSDVTDAARTDDADIAPTFAAEKNESAEIASPATEAADATDVSAAQKAPAVGASARADTAKAASKNAGTSATPTAAHAPGELVTWVWLIGAIALVGFEIGSYFITRLRLRTATRLEGNVFQSERVPGPFVLGFIRPRIYMPYRMSADAEKYALAHERAHIRRGDNVAKPLAFVLVAAYWFDPLVWLAYVLFCRDIELACDEKVIRAYDDTERRAYASALLEIGSGKNVLNTVICPLAFGNTGIKERIKKVVNYKKVSAIAVALAIVLGALTAAFFLTDPISADNEGNIKLTADVKREIAEETEKTELTEAAAESETPAETILAPGVDLDALTAVGAKTAAGAETTAAAETTAKAQIKEETRTAPAAEAAPVAQTAEPQSTAKAAETKAAEQTAAKAPAETKAAETEATKAPAETEAEAEKAPAQTEPAPKDAEPLVLTYNPTKLGKLTGMEFPSPDGKIDLERIYKLYEAAKRICVPGTVVELPADGPFSQLQTVTVPRDYTAAELDALYNNIESIDDEQFKELFVNDVIRERAVTAVFWQLVKEYLPAESTHYLPYRPERNSLRRGWAVLDIASTGFANEYKARSQFGAAYEGWHGTTYDFATLWITEDNCCVRIEYFDGAGHRVEINAEELAFRGMLIDEENARLAR